jgi:gluconate 2-dehydrogenase gamma chain
MDDLHGRRMFLRAAAAAGATWMTIDLDQVEAALAWTAEAPQALSVLTKAQADVVDAVASRMLPSVDGRPGAHEAGVVTFVDRSLATFASGQKEMYLAGIQDLDRRAGGQFASLTHAQQDDLLRAIEQTPFFQVMRFHTIAGTFALPTWGGNRDYAGWRLIGHEHQMAFQAPFGFYDAEVNRKG